MSAAAKKNETTHTPGPWSLPEHGEGVLVSGPDKRRVALTAIESDGMFVGRRLVEARANARLIAQAPALYDLARAILHDWAGDGAHPYVTAERRAEQARAILAAIDWSES